MPTSFKWILIHLSFIYFLLEIINNKWNVTQLEYYIIFLTHESTPSENSSLLGCDTGLLGEWFPIFRRSVVHLASGSTSPFLLRLLHEDGALQGGEPLAQWYNITSQKTWIFSNTSWRMKWSGYVVCMARTIILHNILVINPTQKN